MSTATEPPPTTLSCPTCAGPRTPAAITCPFCGAQLKPLAATPAVVSAPPAHTTPPATDAEGRPQRSATPLHGGATRGMAAMGLLFLAMGLLFVFLFNGMMIRDYRRDTASLAALQQEGVAVRGEISDQRVDDDGDSTDYLVSYRFSAPVNGDPRTFIREIEVQQRDYRRLTLGTRVKVTYARSDPAVSAIEGYWPQPSLAFTAGMLVVVNLFLLIFVGVGGSLLAWGLHTMRQAGQLRREGLTGEGTVTARWSDTDSDGDTTYYLAVEFVPTGSGQQVVLRQQVGRASYLDLADGARVPIRYLTSDPTVAGVDRQLL